MHSTQQESDAVCGNCREYEPSRTDANYGYCGPRERIEQEKNNGRTGRLVGVTTPCFVVVWHGVDTRPAFEPKSKT